MSVNTLANVLVSAFQCMPVKAAFDATVKGSCINVSLFYVGNAITGVITDSTIWSVSIVVLKPLQMDWKRKMIAIIPFALGTLCVVTLKLL